MQSKSQSDRPNWHEYFMNIAHMVKTRATCPKIAVGAVVVKDRRILGTGYNGAPRGIPHCLDHGCCEVNNHCVSVVHAEVNAILQSLMGGSTTEGATVYCTTLPCVECSKIIMNSGVKMVVYESFYNDNRAQALKFNSSKDYLESAGVEVWHVKQLIEHEVRYGKRHSTKTGGEFLPGEVLVELPR